MQALVDTLAVTVAVEDAVTLGNTRDDSHALFDTLAYTLAEVRAQSDTRRCACTARHWQHGCRGGGGDTSRSTKQCARTGDSLPDTLPEVEAVGDTRSDPHSLVDTLSETLAEVEAVTLGDTRGDAHALVDTLADTLGEVEEVT